MSGTEPPAPQQAGVPEPHVCSHDGRKRRVDLIDRIRRFLAAVIVSALVFPVLFASLAFSHAGVVGTEPANGAILTASPAELSVEFTEPVTPVAVRLFDAAMRELLIGAPPVLDGTVLRFAAQNPLADGTYVASVRVTSQDGHPVGVTYMFDVGTASLSGRDRQAVLSELSSDPWRIPAYVSRLAFYGFALFACGGALFAALVGMPAINERQIAAFIRGSAVYGLIASAPYLLLTGAQLNGADPRSVDLVAIADAIRASADYERVFVAAIGLTVIATISAWTVTHVGARLILLAGALAIAASFALASHVVTRAESMLAYRSMIVVHVLFGAFWIGSLIPLFIILGDLKRYRSGPILRRFSSIAGIGIIFLAATGIVMAARLLTGFSDLWTTDYGLRFSGKIALITALIFIAFFNRLILTPGFNRETGQLAKKVGRSPSGPFSAETLKLALSAQMQIDGMRRMISVDIVLAIGIVGMTASLALDKPSGDMAGMREMNGPGERPSLELVADNYQLTMPMPLPARRSEHGFLLDVHDSSGDKVRPKEALFSAQPLDVDVLPLRWRSNALEDGSLSFSDLRIPFAGRWHFAIDVLIDDFTTVRFEERIAFETDTGPAGQTMGPRSVADTSQIE